MGGSSLSTRAIPYIKDVYLKHEHTLIPDAATQHQLARLLDPHDTWRLLAQDFNVQFAGGVSQHPVSAAASPTKRLLHVLGMRGNRCNWHAFSERLRHYNLNQAATVLCDWYSEQTIPKTH